MNNINFWVLTTWYQLLWTFYHFYKKSVSTLWLKLNSSLITFPIYIHTCILNVYAYMYVCISLHEQYIVFICVVCGCYLKFYVILYCTCYTHYFHLISYFQFYSSCYTHTNVISLCKLQNIIVICSSK